LIVTANARADWAESLLPLMWRGVMPTVFLLDPNSYGDSTDLNAITHALEFMNVPCHVIPRTIFGDRGSLPGEEGKWEWRVSGTGKAVAVKAPLADWRRLA
jgi:hypothetical protein